MSQNAFQPIRAVAPSDAVEISRIIEEAHLNSQFPVGPKWRLEQVQEECEAQGGWVFARPNGGLDSFILFRKGADAFEITFLATAFAARGQGRMLELLRHLVAHLGAVDAVWLEVHEANVSARKLYEKIGFREVGRRPRYYSDGGTAVLYNYG